MKSNNTNTFPQRVKERVDFVYQLLTENPSGYRGGFSSQDALTRIVVRCLVRRNVVQKGDKIRNTYIYQWRANMAPTKVLYKNILEDVQKEPSHNKHSPQKADTTPKQKPAEDKDTGFWLMEYSSRQRLFHLSPIYQKENGDRCFEGGTKYHPGWTPIAIIPDPDINEELFNRAMSFIDSYSGRDRDSMSIRNQFIALFPKKYAWTHSGLMADFDELRKVDEEPQKKQCQRFEMVRPKQPAQAFDVAEAIRNISPGREDLLKSLSAQELWDELKRRGAQVLNGELVILQKLS